MRTIKEKISWIDIVKPTKEDIDFLKKHFRFHPIILDELLHLSARSRVEFYKNYLFLTYHLPIYDKNLKTSRRAEIDFLITQDSVITVRYEDLEPIENFFRAVSSNKHFKDLALGVEAGRTVYYIIQEIIHYSVRQLRHIEENISFVTQEIFKGREDELLERISYVKRDILDYSIISKPQEILLNSFLNVGVKFLGEDARIYINDLIGDYYKVTQHIDHYREVVESLENTNGQLLNAKTNKVMQKFTILAFLTFPLVIFASISAIGFISSFFTAHQFFFWSIFFIAGFIIVGLAILFRKRGWL